MGGQGNAGGQPAAKSVTFLMPGRGNRPIGGYKIVYEYANRLAEDGYEVHIVYPLLKQFGRLPLSHKLLTGVKLARWLLQGWSCARWFRLHPSVQEHMVPTLARKFVPRTEHYVATAFGTAGYLKGYRDVPGSRLYLVQGYETWAATPAELDATYRFGLRNIAVADWIAAKIKAAGADCLVAKNGFDFKRFHLASPIDSRAGGSVAMLYHKMPAKGVEYGLKALEAIHGAHPERRIVMFGIFERPASLPEWIEYTCRPTGAELNAIYNGAAVFISPSLTEGWGLTVGESMICGAAVVCTDAEGHLEMVADGETGIVVPRRDPEALAAGALRLLGDEPLRQRLAAAGNRNILRFTWEKSYAALRSALEEGNSLDKGVC